MFTFNITLSASVQAKMFMIQLFPFFWRIGWDFRKLDEKTSVEALYFGPIAITLVR